LVEKRINPKRNKIDWRCRKPKQLYYGGHQSSVKKKSGEDKKQEEAFIVEGEGKTIANHGPRGELKGNDHFV